MRVFVNMTVARIGGLFPQHARQVATAG